MVTTGAANNNTPVDVRRLVITGCPTQLNQAQSVIRGRDQRSAHN